MKEAKKTADSRTLHPPNPPCSLASPSAGGESRREAFHRVLVNESVATRIFPSARVRGEGLGFTAMSKSGGGCWNHEITHVFPAPSPFFCQFLCEKKYSFVSILFLVKGVA